MEAGEAMMHERTNTGMVSQMSKKIGNSYLKVR